MPPCRVLTRHLLLLFSIRRPPPRATLFPYTTLFRSAHHHAEDVARRERHAERGHRVLAHVVAREHPVAALGIDRKSTRLNSSHEWISYAVFCLKKKK